MLPTGRDLTKGMDSTLAFSPTIAPRADTVVVSARVELVPEPPSNLGAALRAHIYAFIQSLLWILRGGPNIKNTRRPTHDASFEE